VALRRTPYDLPGRVIPLPQKCGVCGSQQLFYDRLNIVTCAKCDSLLSQSGRWHYEFVGVWNLPWTADEALSRSEEEHRKTNVPNHENHRDNCPACEKLWAWMRERSAEQKRQEEEWFNAKLKKAQGDRDPKACF
jgi:hypothetical protein